MKELRKKLWAKLLAAALLFLFLAAALGSTVLALVLAEYGIYDNDGSTAGTYCTDYVNDRADIITGRILSIESKDIGVYFRDELAGEFDWQEPSNFAFTVTTVGGNTVYTYDITTKSSMVIAVINITYCYYLVTHNVLELRPLELDNAQGQAY